MEQYIPKSAVVAKIYKLKKSHDNWSCMGKSFHRDYETLLSFIDTFEVKKVDLEAEIEKWQDSFKHCPTAMGYKETAKHFFELGLQVQKGE